MLKVLYEDQELLVAVKPAGMESQAARRFEPDMVSAIRNHLVMNKSCTPGQAPYVGVIHRLDKPVSGVMVYAKTKNAAAALSSQLQKHQMKKVYEAVVCGKPVNSVENLVDKAVENVDNFCGYPHLSTGSIRTNGQKQPPATAGGCFLKCSIGQHYTAPLARFFRIISLHLRFPDG